MNKSTSGAPQIARIDWLPRIDFFLDHPAKDVWPLLVHWEKWIKTYRSEHVSGPIDAVGEIKKISSLAPDGSVSGYFLIEIVRLVPKERLAYRILSRAEFSLAPVEAIHGYEIFNVYEIGGRTLVTYQTIAEMETSKLSQAEFDAQNAKDLEVGVRSWHEMYVPELRKLLQSNCGRVTR